MVGYKNIVSVPPVPEAMLEGAEICIGFYHNLDPVVNDDEAEEIVFSQPLNVLQPESLIQCLDHWYKKLKDDGVLKFYFLDIVRVSRAINNGEINHQDMHYAIFGKDYIYRSVLDVQSVTKGLEHVNYKIDTMSAIDNPHVISVEVRK